MPGKLEQRRSLSKRSLFLRPVALAAVVLAAWSGQAAYAASARTVTITVDGQRSSVRTHGATVGDALRAANLTVGSHDLLAPAPSTRLSNRTTVVLRRGREITLTVDGAPRQVWVTATSVSEALDQIGLRTAGALLSADRSRALPLKGFSLDIRTRKSVQLLDAGKVRRISTNALTVQQALHDGRVTLRSSDRLSVLRSAQVRNGMVIRITRIRGSVVGEDVEIPFATERRPDSSMYTGTEKVVREGRVGVVHRVYNLKYVNGRLAKKLLAKPSVRTAEPITEVVAYGTKQRPYSVAGADGLNWGALANCESGGNPRAVSSGGNYRGLYQFTIGTWHSVGGDGDPVDAASGEQTYRAKLLYKQRGRSPWPVCGKYL
ncbi:MAG: rpfB1 [Frankiales bacterium]|nr:rpfB1 [Frankiales bacterium]